MIRVGNDGKGKCQSFEAVLTMNKGEFMGHSIIEICGYGATEIEAVYNLRKNAKDVIIDMLLHLEDEVERVEDKETLYSKDEQLLAAEDILKQLGY